MKSTELRHLIAVFAVAVATPLCAPAHAGPFSDMVVFGDDLSDTGNLFAVTGGTNPPSPPYFNGRFSNGPVWVETLAAGLGLPTAAAPFTAGGSGQNFAFGGALTGTTVNPPAMLRQVENLWGPLHAAADPNALYVVVGGLQDMVAASLAFSGNSAADQAGRQAAAQAAITNLESALTFLASRGAKNVLVANLYDLGLTPASLGQPASDATDRFNALMPTMLSFGSSSLGLQMSFLDIDALFDAVRDDALNNGGGVYGITNVNATCAGFASGVLPCDTSLFSDTVHPSAHTHVLLGQAALAAVGEAAVPEPATLALLGLGLAGLGFSRRRTLN